MATRYNSVIALLVGLLLFPVWIIVIPYAEAQTPFSDFNGDGFADLAVGIPGEDINGISDAGAVNVLYGSSTGLLAAASGSTPSDQLWHEDSSGVRGVAETGDMFGSSLAAGDFNNDGYDDLAIGIPFQDVNGMANAGAVEVLYGSPTGLRSSASGTTPDDQRWNQDSTGVKDTSEDSDRFGAELAAGNFNGDGFDDLVIGVRNELDAFESRGGISILHGSAIGLRATASGQIPDDQFWTDVSPGFDSDNVDNVFLGSTLAVGDFNGDGFDDLAAGMHYSALDGFQTGSVSVLYGSSMGLQATSPAYQSLNPDTLDTVSDDGRPGLGDQVASGDFNKDGYDDLAFSSHTTKSGDATPFQLWIMYGSTSGLQKVSPPLKVFSQGGDGLKDSSDRGDDFGSTLAVGDFNKDGYYDLAAGISSEDIGAIVDVGAVQVLYGSSSGIQGTSPDDQFWNQNSVSVLDLNEAGDRFGGAVAAGDINNDGYDDLCIGVPSENIGAIGDAGSVNVIYGSASGLRASASGTTPDDQLWNQNSLSVLDTSEAGDLYGYEVAVG